MGYRTPESAQHSSRRSIKDQSAGLLLVQLSKFTGEIILESRIDKQSPGHQFAKIPCPFISLLALLAQAYPDEIQKMGKRF